MLNMEHLWVVFLVRNLVIRFSATGPTFFLWFSVESYDSFILAPTTNRVKRKIEQVVIFRKISRLKKPTYTIGRQNLYFVLYNTTHRIPNQAESVTHGKHRRK